MCCSRTRYPALYACAYLNPLDSKGNYSATSNNTKLLHWPLVGVLLGTASRAATPPIPLLAVPNVTAYPSTASIPITVLLYDGPLLCGFNVAIKELNSTLAQWSVSTFTRQHTVILLLECSSSVILKSAHFCSYTVLDQTAVHNGDHAGLVL